MATLPPFFAAAARTARTASCSDGPGGKLSSSTTLAPPSTAATYDAQVWGSRTQAAVAMGAAGLSLRSEVPVRVLPDALGTVNEQPPCAP